MGCKNGIRGGTVKKSIKNNMSILTFKCKFDKFGCKRELGIDKIDKHDGECQYRCVQCDACKQLITIAKSSEHRKQCSMNQKDIVCS
jgi:hypothetical protein